jgi:regulator of protease activity HflC (stomatin/prohibitin superfamily)
MLMASYGRGGQAPPVTGTLAVVAEVRHLAVGLVIWLLVYFHGRTRRLAEHEREERERLRATRLSEEIFEDTRLDATSASAVLRIFEKYIVTMASVVLGLGMLALAFFLGMVSLGIAVWVEAAPEGFEVAEMTAGAAKGIAVGMVCVAFFGFLIGKYAAGLAQSPDLRLLRAAGGYVMGNVIACLLIMVAVVFYYFGVEWPERVVAVAIPAIMALVGLEVLLNLVLDIYRPRVEGQERRPPYDSRLLGLFAEPGGVLKTVATTLDYQFGFKVSETWFYRFVERAIMPLLLVQLASLWLLTCIVVVDQEEIVFIEKFGRPYLNKRDRELNAGLAEPDKLKASVYEAGFHLKAPWPFAVARRVPAYRVHEVELGKIYEREILGELLQPDMRAGAEGRILWNERHIDPKLGKEANFVIPAEVSAGEDEAAARQETSAESSSDSDSQGRAQAVPAVNLARLKAFLYYRIRRAQDGRIDPMHAYEYYYRQSDIEHHVDLLAYRALCRVAASQDFLKWMAQDRDVTIGRLREIVQETFDRNGLGLEVTFVGISAIHPPYETYPAYENVIAMRQTKEKLIQDGWNKAVEMAAEARIKEVQVTNQAHQVAARKAMAASAEAELFDARLTVCRDGGKTPEESERIRRVYLFRSYCDAMEDVLPGQQVHIVPTTNYEVDIIDLSKQLHPQLLEGLTAPQSQEE